MTSGIALIFTAGRFSGGAVRPGREVRGRASLARSRRKPTLGRVAVDDGRLSTLRLPPVAAV